MNETKRKVYVERDGFLAEASMMLMGIAVVCCLVGSIGHWSDMNYLVTQVALPAFSGLLFILCTVFFGRRAFWTTVIPVVLGVVYFIFRAMGMEGEMVKVAFIVGYVVVVVLFAMTFSHVGLKWVLALVLLGGLAYHVLLIDVPALMERFETITLVGGMQELSVLAVLLSMFFISLAIKASPLKDKEPETDAAEEDGKKRKGKKKKGSEPAEAPTEPAEAPTKPAEAPAEPAGVPAEPAEVPAKPAEETPAAPGFELEPEPGAEPSAPAEPAGPIGVIGGAEDAGGAL